MGKRHTRRATPEPRPTKRARRDARLEIHLRDTCSHSQREYRSPGEDTRVARKPSSRQAARNLDYVARLAPTEPATPRISTRGFGFLATRSSPSHSGSLMTTW